MTMDTTIASEVNVYERPAPKGRKHFQYDFKVTLPDGKIYRERRKARGATSESAARQIGLRRMHDVLRHGPSSRKAVVRVPTVEEFAVQWLEKARTDRQKPSTLRNKAIFVRSHLLPLLGSLRLDEISQKTLDMVKKARAHLGPGSMNNLIKGILAMLRCAKDTGYKVEIPKAAYLDHEVEADWYTPEEFEALVKSAATFTVGDLVLILLAGEAGLRTGEVGALRWADVDFVQREINIRNNLVRGHEGTPKSGRSRKVPMTGRLYDALTKHRTKEGREGRVLRREDGSDMPGETQRSMLGRVARYAGLPAYGMHALRHCFGSRLIRKGGPKVVMQLMGHAKLQTTERYIHASDDHCRSAIDLLTP